MTFIWSTAVKDLRRRLNDPMSLLLWLLVPFGILALIMLAFGSNDTQPQAHLLLDNRDDSIVSSVMLGALGQGELAELIRVEEVESDEGRERIDAGEGSGLLIIPEGFGNAVLNSHPTELVLLTNPSQIILPGILEEVLSAFVDAAFYLQHLLGDELASLAAGPAAGAATFDPQFITGMSLTINQLAGDVVGYLNPPLIELVIEHPGDPEEKPAINFGPLFFQSMFFMALVFMAGGFAEDIWVEREAGTLRRAATTPRAVGAVLAGKYLAVAVLFAAIAAIVLPIGSWLFDFSLATLPVGIAWVGFSGLLLYSMFSLIHLFASSQRGAGILTNLVLFPMLLMGGSFFPFEAMPPWLAAIGRWAPNGFALEQLKAILSADATPSRLLIVAGALLVVVAFAFVLSAWRLERSFARAS